MFFLRTYVVLGDIGASFESSRLSTEIMHICKILAGCTRPNYRFMGNESHQSNDVSSQNILFISMMDVFNALYSGN